MKAILIAAAVLIHVGATLIVLACCKISGDCARQEEARAAENQIKEEPTP